MSISLKVYNKIGYEDVYPGMVLRIVTEGPGIKSDVEGRVKNVWRFGILLRLDSDLPRVSFWGTPNTTHIIEYPSYETDTTVELYEVIDAIPDEPKGVGAVVRVVNLNHPDRTMEAVKTGQDGSWVWESTDWGMMWESISDCVLSQNYDYIKVLSKGVEL